ncbi:pentatricopeptide repeat-containing protein, partial [Quercus suber]
MGVSSFTKENNIHTSSRPKHSSAEPTVMCFISLSAKISLISHRVSKFRAFSHMGFSSFARERNTCNSRSLNEALQNIKTAGAEMEKSIYTLLTIDRWESLNHMEYRLASLRPVHGRLALKFLNWVIKQPGLELNHLTHILCITTHVLVRARMYDSAKSILRHLSQMGIGTNSVFGAVMDTYPLCNSNPAVFDLLIRVYIRERMVRDAVETFYLMGFRGFRPSVFTCNMILASMVKDRRAGLVWSFFKEMLGRE